MLSRLRRPSSICTILSERATAAFTASYDKVKCSAAQTRKRKAEMYEHTRHFRKRKTCVTAWISELRNAERGLERSPVKRRSNGFCASRRGLHSERGRYDAQVHERARRAFRSHSRSSCLIICISIKWERAGREKRYPLKTHASDSYDPISSCYHCMQSSDRSRHSHPFSYCTCRSVNPRMSSLHQGLDLVYQQRRTVHTGHGDQRARLFNGL